MSKLWESETERLIKSIRNDRDTLAQDCEKLNRALSLKNEELVHWEAVKESYRRHQELEAPQPSLFLQDSDAIKDLSHKDIILLVRDQNDGLIPMKQATAIFKEKVSNPTNAASAAYSTVGRLVKQGKVEKVREGVYRWINGMPDVNEYVWMVSEKD